MSKQCSERAKLIGWAMQGCGAPSDARLLRHASGCRECSALLDEVTTVRDIFRRSPEPTLAHDTAAAVRFALMATARNAPHGPAPRRSRVSWHWAAAALGLVALVTALVHVRRNEVRDPAQTPTASHLATVRLEPDGAGSFERAPPDEVYDLLQGTAEFRVDHLRPGQRFRVRTGLDIAEVRGTHFRIRATDAHFERVEVLAGRVAVSSNGVALADLTAGETWQRAGDSTRGRSVPAASGPAEVSANLPARPASDAPTRARGAESGTPLRAERTVARTVPPTPRTMASPPASSDAAFARAWRLLITGKASAAAAEFDQLAESTDSDRARRADALYWAAEAHRRAGDVAQSDARALSLLGNAPQAWHADEAALLLGRSAFARGDSVQARRWLSQAASSPNPRVSAAARRLLAQLDASSSSH